MAITLYELAGADPALRFSPYCWRARLAIAHKDLPVQTIAWRFADKAKIAFSGQARVPVIRDGKQVVADSWAIAEHLEDRYPEHPSLFGSHTGRAHARLINAWADNVINPLVVRMVARDVWSVLNSDDQAYYRSSREARYGASLEQVVAKREERREEFRNVTMLPVRATLQAQEWLGGESPSYADYIVFSALQWARCVSPGFPLIAADDPLHAWSERIMSMFGNLAGKALTA
jgi:glutathione S-transferase